MGTLVAGGVKQGLVAAYLVKHFGGVYGQTLDKPTGTITARDHNAIAALALAKFRGTSPGQPMSTDPGSPLPTVSASGIHVAQVLAFLSSRGVTSEPVVMVDGAPHAIVDIGMRMLEPHELLRAQFGTFAENYDLSAATTKSAQVRLIGNSVCPQVAEALVRANVRTERSEAA
jgi:DNA (cytosine-5)-methyltransferase 1